MFGKLIKNEIKSTAHTIGLIYIVAAIAIGLGRVARIRELEPAGTDSIGGCSEC